MKSLELHYPMIQFLIISVIPNKYYSKYVLRAFTQMDHRNLRIVPVCVYRT